MSQGLNIYAYNHDIDTDINHAVNVYEAAKTNFWMEYQIWIRLGIMKQHYKI